MAHLDIALEDIEALARKLEGVTGIDDRDREVLAVVLVMAAQTLFEQPEVAAFGVGCTCFVDSSRRVLYRNPKCPYPYHASGGGW